MALVATSAFANDELFANLLHPHRHEHPLDFTLFFERRFQRHWMDPARQFMVGVDESRRVVGLAEWERQGKGHQLGCLGRYKWGFGMF